MPQPRKKGQPSAEELVNKNFAISSKGRYTMGNDAISVLEVKTSSFSWNGKFDLEVASTDERLDRLNKINLKKVTFNKRQAEAIARYVFRESINPKSDKEWSKIMKLIEHRVSFNEKLSAVLAKKITEKRIENQVSIEGILDLIDATIKDMRYGGTMSSEKRDRYRKHLKNVYVGSDNVEGQSKKPVLTFEFLKEFIAQAIDEATATRFRRNPKAGAEKKVKHLLAMPLKAIHKKAHSRDEREFNLEKSWGAIVEKAANAYVPATADENPFDYQQEDSDREETRFTFVGDNYNEGDYDEDGYSEDGYSEDGYSKEGGVLSFDDYRLALEGLPEEEFNKLTFKM